MDREKPFLEFEAAPLNGILWASKLGRKPESGGKGLVERALGAPFGRCGDLSDGSCLCVGTDSLRHVE